MKKNITLFHYRLDHGGIDRVAAILAGGFATAGYNTTLLLFCANGSGEDIYFPDMDRRVNIIYLGDSQSSRTQDLLRLFPKAVQWLKNNPVDYLLSTCNNMNWITALAAWRSQCDAKIIFKTTNPIIRKADNRLYAAIRRFGYAKAFQSTDKILTLSEAESEQLRKYFPASADKFQAVINPYVTPEMLYVADNKPTIDALAQGQKFILSIGRFEVQKNIPLLIRSYAKLPEAIREEYKLVILGDGSLKHECERLASDLSVANDIYMPGFAANVTDYLHTAELYIMTSEYEGLPAVIFEALAANCPILTTNCFLAAREIIEPLDACHIIEDEAPSNIANMIKKMLGDNNKSHKLSQAAQKYSIENGIADHIHKLSTLL